MLFVFFLSLIFDDDIKDRLLNYMRTVSLYGSNEIDRNLITWNGVILLHGPPGTGKTSLCKALAQKLSIRCSNKYTQCHLMEINSHSLFSKWFSESGKLIQKMFKTIIELSEYDGSLIFVLIDEVESLAAARSSANNGCEPSDSIRAVNALLTQIDKLKSFQNVLILTTSNISQSIDLAFVDRADFKQFIGFPSDRAKYHILKSCLNELLNKNILFPQIKIEKKKVKKKRKKYDEEGNDDNEYLLEYEKIKGLQYDDDLSFNTDLVTPIPFPSPNKPKRIDIDYREQCSQKLYDIIKTLDGFSGRTLRKLPFMTSVNFIKSEKCSLSDYLNGLEKMVLYEKKQRNKLEPTKSFKSELSI